LLHLRYSHHLHLIIIIIIVVVIVVTIIVVVIIIISSSSSNSIIIIITITTTTTTTTIIIYSTLLWVIFAGFSRSDSLNRHMITHSQVKMFECTQCGHEFKHLESLNKHCRRIHDVLRPLKRDECLKHNHRQVKVPKKGKVKSD
jgi:hypothetical protein